jgi:hypothetical protein
LHRSADLNVTDDDVNVVVRGADGLDGAARVVNHKQRFDGVLPAAADNAYVYAAACREAVHSVFDTIPPSTVAIIAFGPRQSGKSYCMCGPIDYTHRGISPRAVQHVFTELQARPELEISIAASYCEVYNDALLSLLGPEADPQLPGGIGAARPAAPSTCSIVDDPTLGPVVKGLHTVPCATETDALRCYFAGEDRRVRAAAAGDGAALSAAGPSEAPAPGAGSHRGHGVFTLHVKRRARLGAGRERVVHTRLHLVDLAGFDHSAGAIVSAEPHPVLATRSVGYGVASPAGLLDAAAAAARETAAINRSLAALEQCAASAAQARWGRTGASGGGGVHVPYRAHKLTHLLSDVLSGRGGARAVFLACLRPEAGHLDLCLSTLRLAQRLCALTPGPSVHGGAEPGAPLRARDEGRSRDGGPGRAIGGAAPAAASSVSPVRAPMPLHALRPTGGTGGHGSASAAAGSGGAALHVQLDPQEVIRRQERVIRDLQQELALYDALRAGSGSAGATSLAAAAGAATAATAPAGSTPPPPAVTGAAAVPSAPSIQLSGGHTAIATPSKGGGAGGSGAEAVQMGPEQQSQLAAQLRAFLLAPEGSPAADPHAIPLTSVAQMRQLLLLARRLVTQAGADEEARLRSEAAQATRREESSGRRIAAAAAAAPSPPQGTRPARSPVESPSALPAAAAGSPAGAAGIESFARAPSAAASPAATRTARAEALTPAAQTAPRGDGGGSAADDAAGVAAAAAAAAWQRYRSPHGPGFDEYAALRRAKRGAGAAQAAAAAAEQRADAAAKACAAAVRAGMPPASLLAAQQEAQRARDAAEAAEAALGRQLEASVAAFRAWAVTSGALPPEHADAAAAARPVTAPSALGASLDGVLRSPAAAGGEGAASPARLPLLQQQQQHLQASTGSRAPSAASSPLRPLTPYAGSPADASRGGGFKPSGALPRPGSGSRSGAAPTAGDQPPLLLPAAAGAGWSDAAASPLFALPPAHSALSSGGGADARDAGEEFAALEWARLTSSDPASGPYVAATRHLRERRAQPRAKPAAGGRPGSRGGF